MESPRHSQELAVGVDHHLVNIKSYVRRVQDLLDYIVKVKPNGKKGVLETVGADIHTL